MMSEGLSAILLAAGIGSRLKPVTDRIPKCLVEIGGEKLLGLWLEKLENAGCSKVVVNTHYLAEIVEGYLGARKPSNMEIKIAREEQLLGTAGTLLRNREETGKKSTIVIHADNVMEEDLKGLIATHEQRESHCIMTMLAFETNVPESCGIIELDRKGNVGGFYEKVSNPPGRLANGAVFIMEPEVFEFMEGMDPKPFDFSADVLPMLLGRIAVYKTNGFFLDIGTPDRLKMAQEIWRT